MMTPKRKICLICVFFLTAVFLLFFFLIRPMLGRIKENTARISQEESNLKVIEDQISAFNDFLKKDSVYQRYVSIVGETFVSPDAPIRFMEFLEEQAAMLNIEIDIASVSFAKDPKVSAGFRITVRGHFPNAVRFLERLERSQWLVDITNLAITRVSESQIKAKEETNLKIGDVSFTITVKALAPEAATSDSPSSPSGRGPS